MHTPARITMILMLAAALALGASEEAKNNKEAGKSTFQETCAMCHSITGEDGIGLLGASFRPGGP